MDGHNLYRGVAPGVKLISADSGSYQPQSNIATVSDCVISSPYSADVLNLSFGNSDAPYDFWTRYFDHVVWSDRRTVVVAADENGDGQIANPDSGYNVLTVGGFTDNDNANWSDDAISSFSDFQGPGSREKPEVVAVAGNICTTNIYDVDCSASGTSFAAPQVSGLAALVITLTGQTRTPELIKSIIMASALHNIEGASRLSDRDGVGGIDGAAAYTVASHGRYGVSAEGWYDYKTVYYASFDGDGYLHYYVPIDRGEKVRVVLVYDSHPDSGDPYGNDTLQSDLDLRVYRPNGTAIVSSISTDESFEIVEFIADQTGIYDVRVVRATWNTTYEYLGIAWVKDATYLPDLRNKDSWVSTLFVRNDGPVTRTSSAAVKVQYFTSSGTPTIQDACMLAPNQWCWIPVNDYNRIPAGSTGSAIVGGGEDVSVAVVNRIQPTVPRAGYAYSGQPLLNAPATTLYLPETLDLGTWLMRLPVFNTGQSATDIVTQFFNSDGGTRSVQTHYSVPGNGQSIEFPYSDLDPYNSYAGAGRISASQPVAAVAQVFDNTARRLGYWATSSAATTVGLPFVMTRLNNGWGATVWVQNTTGTASYVSIDFFQEGSRTVYRTTGFVPLASNGMTSFNLRTNDYGLGWGWFGSAQVKTNPPVPIAVIVNQLNDGSNLGASYEGVPASAGSKSVILPYVVRGDTGCFYSNFAVQNLGGSDAAITLHYHSAIGDAPVATSYDTVVSHRVYNLYTATPGGQTFPAAPFAGSVVINSNQPIAVTTNLLNYCGGDDTVSYTGVPR